ncbi:hypothetical protein QCE73_37310 [Caballeronia sp. LZ029]|nr:hypothetical protein [Caballeronia sp. LZ029]
MFGDMGPQTPGVDTSWSGNGIPVGENNLQYGTVVALVAATGGVDWDPDADVAIRFDILRKELTDTRIGSILNEFASPASGEAFPLIERRLTCRIVVRSFEPPEATINQFVLQHPLDYQQYMLILTDCTESDAAQIITWWTITDVDADNSEGDFYFVVNVGESFDDKSNPPLRVRGKRSTTQLVEDVLDSTEEDEEDDESNAADAGDLDPDVYADLPPIPDAAIDEISFREAALSIVRDSGVLDELTQQDRSYDDSSADKAGAAVTEPANGLIFPPVDVLSNEFESNDAATDEEFSRPQDLGPYGTGWMFIHPDDDPTHPDDRVEKGPTDLDAITLLILRDESWTTLSLDTRNGYRMCYQFDRAIHWGRTLYAVKTFAILELPLFDRRLRGLVEKRDPKGIFRTAYIVAPLMTPFSTAELDRGNFDGLLDSVYIRYVKAVIEVVIPWAPSEKWYAALRVVSTVQRELLSPVRPDYVYLEFNRQLSAVKDEPPEDPDLREKLRSAAFTAVDAALVTHDDEAAEQALAALDFYAFGLLTRERRRELIAFAIGRLGVRANDKLDHILLELFKAAEDKKEIDDIVLQLGPKKLTALVTGMESELWRLLTLLGDKLPLQKADVEFVATILELVFFGKRSTSGMDAAKRGAALSIGPAGMVVASDFVASLYQGAVRLVRFVEGTVSDIIKMVTNPRQIIDAAGQLMKLFMTVEMARLPVPDRQPNEPKWMTKLRKDRDDARKSIATTLDKVSKEFMKGYSAAIYLKLEEQIVLRVYWTVLWEVLSLFVGVGEIKSAVNVVRAGIEAGSISLIIEKIGVSVGTRAGELFRSFSRMLGRESRLITSEEEAMRALSRLSKDELKKIEVTLANAEGGTALEFNQLLKTDADFIIAKRQEIEAWAVITRKTAGPLPHAVEDVIAKMTSVSGVTEKELLAIVEKLPDGEGARFIEAVRALSPEALTGAQAYVNPAFLKQLAARPDWMQVIRRGDQAIFSSIYRHTAGDATKVDDMLRALDDVAAKELRSTVAKVEAGDQAVLDRLAGSKKPPLEPPGRVQPQLEPAGVHREIRDLFNNEVDFYIEANGFDDATRTALDKLADEERGMFRSLVTDLRKSPGQRKERFLKKLGDAGYTLEEVQEADNALELLNKEFRSHVDSKVGEVLGDAQIDTRLSGVKKYQDAGRVKVREIDQRIKEYNQRKRSRFSSGEEKKRAADRVSALKREKQQLKDWIKDTDARRKELADLAPTVKDSPLLRDRLAHGGDKALFRTWADMKFRPKGRPPVKSTFERYFVRRIGEFRGYGGEMDLACLMADDFVLLKAPDSFVTRTGLDLVALRRGEKGTMRTLAILDNKSFAMKVIDDVSALTRNLVKNLRNDAAEFRKVAAGLAKPQREYTEMADRMTKAANELEPLLKDVSFGAKFSLEAEARVLGILRENRIPTSDISVVTRNLATELRGEAQGFRRLASEFSDVSPDYLDAARRMTNAADRLEPILARYPRGVPLKLADEAEIASILADNKMQILVTNVSGKSEEVSPILGKHIQMWNVQEAARAPALPAPPVP